MHTITCLTVFAHALCHTCIENLLKGPGTTTGIQSEADTFDESRFIMTFSTTLGIIEILCSFRLVLEGKTGKADLPLLRTLLAIHKMSWEPSF